MSPNVRFLVLALVTGLASPAAVRCDDKLPRPPMGCAAAVDNYFEEEVWAKVGLRKCLTCHRKGGDAEDSKFVLIDPRKRQGAARGEAMRHNRAAFARMAAVKEKNQSRMLLKVVGELDHGGSDVLTPDSVGYRILADFVRRVNGRGAGKTPAVVADPKAPPFFQGVVMLDDRRLLRRVTLSLAGRLPTDAELAAIARDGPKAMPAAPRRRHERGRLLRPAPRGVQRHLPHARHRRQRGPNGAVLRALREDPALVSAATT